MIEEINMDADYLSSLLDIGDIKMFIELMEGLSVLTYKNMQKDLK